jgi:putative spermidine/putrescine transport system permease protein
MLRWPAALLRLYIALMCVFLLAPIVIVVILAFSGDGYLRFPPTAVSVQWFARFFGNLQWQRALLSSLIIGVIACVVSTAVGFFAAYAFLRCEFRGKKLLLSLLLTPIVVPSIITAPRDVLSGRQARADRQLSWLGLCHAVIAMPIVLLILLSRRCMRSIPTWSAPRSVSARAARGSSAAWCCRSCCRACCLRRCSRSWPRSTNC